MKHSNIALFIPHNGCPHQCSFCNQRTISGAVSQPSADDVRSAVNVALSSRGFNGDNAEIAFFGGSFTAIAREYMLELLSAAHEFVSDGRVAGIRVSTRPDAISCEILDILSRYGVTSIELGAQSMRDEVLELNKRGHSSEDVVNASKLVKQYGFSLGLQMMTGLYGDDNEGAIYTAHRLAALEPDTVRIYPTVVLDGTELADRMREGKYRPQGFEDAADLCAELLEFFESREIRVIKLGLHASDGVDGEQIGGAYHPAFRELCEGRIYLRKMREYLAENYPQGGEFTVLVDRREISKACGQKKCNIAALRDGGWNVRIKGDDFTDEEKRARLCKFEQIHKQASSPRA